jgi:hypothetical protein
VAGTVAVGSVAEKVSAARATHLRKRVMPPPLDRLIALAPPRTQRVKIKRCAAE